MSIQHSALKRSVLEILDSGDLNKGLLEKRIKVQLPNIGVNRIGREVTELIVDGTITARTPEGSSAKICSLL